ncbi:hypothetical protein L218DRAFT_1080873 [Marasmius fiardii PR-910]|nr:hypothetical protein L218DRAFT_1080873 [Marasmius fiardii PR-910]
MKAPTASLVIALASVSQVLAVCDSFMLAVGSQQKLGGAGNSSRWTVYDTTCKTVDSLTTDKNPCSSEKFKCSPPPVHFTAYYNGHITYDCQLDPKPEVCGKDVISVCCRLIL